MCIYRTEGRYQEDATANEQRVICRKTTRFTLCDGELLYKKEQVRVVLACHDDLTSGHWGSERELCPGLSMLHMVVTSSMQLPVYTLDTSTGFIHSDVIIGSQYLTSGFNLTMWACTPAVLQN